MNLIASKNADKLFITNDITNWQDAGTKNRDFNKHFQSETHWEAHERLFTIPNACGDIFAQLSDEARSLNWQNLLKILSNLQFLVRQALFLIGHRSGEDSNFTQLYILWEVGNEGLKAWRIEKKINKYVHSTFKMMQIMALKVLWEVPENIQNVDFYSIMWDKATNVKNVSELVVCFC